MRTMDILVLLSIFVIFSTLDHRTLLNFKRIGVFLSCNMHLLVLSTKSLFDIS